MGKGRAWIGLLVGLAGAGLMGWGLFGIFTSPECLAYAAATGSQSCSSNPPLPGILAIAGGVLLAVIGIVLRGGILVFLALFMAIGLSALVPAWLGPMPDMQTFGWTFGWTSLGYVLFPLFIGLVLWCGAAAKRAIAAELMRTGVPGIGTVIEVGDIGTTNDDDPRITIRMRIEPLDGAAAVERSKELTVTQVAVPRLGERYPAWFDRTDRDRWMFATEMEEGATAEVKDMFARARASGDAAGDSPAGELARLSELWKDGALTDAEFADAKARLLPRIGR